MSNINFQSKHVARLLKSSWVYQGKVSPTAFQLRPGLKETYISVLCEEMPTFLSDARTIVMGKDKTQYASLPKEEIEERDYQVNSDKVAFTIKPADNNTFKSHAGIFISVNGHGVTGGEPFKEFMKEDGVPESTVLQEIGLFLADIAEKNLKTLNFDVLNE